MATGQAYINKTTAWIAVVVAKAVVQAILAERGDEDVLTRHRSEEAGMRHKARKTLTNIQLYKRGKDIYHTCN